MANIVGYTYKGRVYTPLGMKAMLIKTNRIGRNRFEPRTLGGHVLPEPPIADVIAEFVRICGHDMDAPDTYDSDHLPKPVFDDEVTPERQAYFLSMRHVYAEPLHEHDLCPACNPVSDEEVMRRNGGKIPARIVAKVYFDGDSNPEYPWFYTVDAIALHDPEGEGAVIDYGNVANRETAWLCVKWALEARELCDNPEYQHVRSDRR